MRFLLFTYFMKNDFEGGENVYLIIDHDQYRVFYIISNILCLIMV